MLYFLCNLVKSKTMLIKCLYFAFICVLGHSFLFIRVGYGFEEIVEIKGDSISITGNPDKDTQAINPARFKRMQQQAPSMEWPVDNSPGIYIPSDIDMVRSEISFAQMQMREQIRDAKQELSFELQALQRELEG